MGFSRAHLCFFIWPFGFKGSVATASCYHHVARFPVPWWSQQVENGMEVEIRGLTRVVRVFMAMWNWLGDSWLGAAASKVGATAHEKFKVLPFGVKIQRLTLIGCAWQWPCWKHCFCEWGLSPRWNLRLMIGQWRCLCTVSFLEASLLEKLDFWCCLGGVSAAATWN
jgi:hypothetical protein